MLVSRLIGIINILCAAMLLALYQPFISVWVRHDPKLILHFLTPLLMVIYFYVNQSRQALLSFKSGASLWREDQWKPVVGGIVKLLTCLLFLVILPENYKLDGVILSTIAEYVFVQIPWESHVVFSVFFDRTKAKEYWRHQFLFLLAVFLISSAAWGTATAIPLDGIPGLLVKCVAASLVSVVLIAMLFRKDILEIMKKGGIRI